MLYARYGQCDDGAIAEGFSDIADKLICRRWDRLDALFTLNDADFFEFVVRHLEEASESRPGTGGAACPPGNETQCRRLQEACDRTPP